MAQPRITIQIEGTAADNGHVRLSDFIEQLDRFKAILRQRDRVLGAIGGYYRVVELSHDSPATVVLEYVNRRRHDIPANRTAIGAVMQDLAEIRGSTEKAVVPPVQDYEILDAYAGMAQAAVEKHIKRITVRAARKSVTIDESFGKKLAKMIGPDEVEHGSISGQLETISLHGNPRFAIYPIVGPKRVTCTFPQRLRRNVIEAIDNYVTLYGRLQTKSWDRYPHAIDVDSLEVHPHAGDLPKLGDLHGLAPDLTGGLPSEEYVSRLRGET